MKNEERESVLADRSRMTAAVQMGVSIEAVKAWPVGTPVLLARGMETEDDLEWIRMTVREKYPSCVLLTWRGKGGKLCRICPGYAALALMVRNGIR